MKLGAIGVGQCGGRILDTLLGYTKLLGYKNVLPITLAVNTAKADLMGLKYIPMKDRILLGKVTVKGHGAGADRRVGERIATEEVNSVRSAITGRGPWYVDAWMVITSTGGGTGSGGSPVIVKHLKEYFSEPVYALAVLPSKNEGALFSLNAASCLTSLKDVADSILAFDNGIWGLESEDIRTSYHQMNMAVARSLPLMLAAGEVEVPKDVGGKVTDASDVIMTLMKTYSVFGHSSWGKPWKQLFKELGYAITFREEVSVEGLDHAARTYSLIQSATLGKLSAECDVKQALNVLMLCAGSPRELNREAAEQGRRWIQSRIPGGEVRGGDFPIPHWEGMDCTVLFSGFKAIASVDRIMAEAEEFRKAREERLLGR